MSPRWRDEVDQSWTGRWDLPQLLHGTLSVADRDALVAMGLSHVGPRDVCRALEACGSVQGAARHLLGERLDDLRARAAGLVDGAAGVRAVTCSDPEYPEILRYTAAPPLVLFVRGVALGELEPFVAVVGARVCTAGGLRFARRLGEAFAAAGLCVTSGLARGIDAAAHEGALGAGYSLAVLGSGVDVVYPAEHRTLADRLTRSGAVVSEFAPGTRPRAWHFPARNRIIAGLCLACVVVEAGDRSGALITAGFALDEGREVLGCTVPPESPSGAGVRKILREGARLIVDPEQAVEDLVALAAAHGVLLDPAARVQAAAVKLEGDAAIVYAAVSEATTVDEIVQRTGLGPGPVARLLTDLCLDGLVADDGGGRWRGLT